MLLDRKSKISEFRRALQHEDPFVFADVMKIPPVDTKKGPKPTDHPKADCEIDGVNWSSVLSAWLDASEAAMAGYASVAYGKQASLHTNFNRILAAYPGNILIPALHTVCRATYRLAVQADVETQSKDSTKLQNAATIIQESFSRTINDRLEYDPSAPYSEEGSKKAGVLFIVNQLFSIYFRLNTLRLCKNLLRPVETRNLHEKSSKSQMVTYRYYVGRLYMFEDQYDKAESNLEYAYRHCCKSALKNKKLILRYLIPVKLCCGRLPSPQLLTRHGLNEFLSLANSIRMGDVRKFNDAMMENQHHFISQGSYMILEKSRLICYRSLLKRVQAAIGKPQIHLTMIQATFKWLGTPMELDDIECILANMIYRGIVRGYIAHTKRYLVLSKRDPFPKGAMVKTIDH